MKLALRPTATRYATHYAACSGLAARWLFGRSKADSGQVHIIKNAINLQQFAYNPGVRRKIRQELNISDETFVIGHVGRLCKQKNQTFLLRVFQDLVRERPDAILLLVGEGPLRTELERVSRELRINKSVRFLGIRDDVEKLYQVFDILAFPSLYEGLGMAVIESQAAGLPVIASTNVPTDAAVTHFPLVQFLPLETGISAWSDKLLTNVHSAREESEVFIEDLVAAGYSIQESADDMQKWYEELLEDHLRSLS
jgi:glycosyltransferase involved in cell wall biosynthesis